MSEIKAYVTNLGKYNKGYLVGEWVAFPITEQEKSDLFARIGVSNEPDADGNYYEEYFITDYESDFNLFNVYGEYVSIDTLNDLAERVEALSEYEKDVLESILEAGYYRDISEALEHVDNYGLAYDVTGAEYEENLTADCFPEISFDRLGWLSNYVAIDYEQMFRDDYNATEVSAGVLYEC